MQAKLKTLKLFRQRPKIVLRRGRDQLKIEQETKERKPKENIPNLLLKQAYGDNDLQTIKVLLNAGANVHGNIGDDGETLLHFAAQSGNVELLKFLLGLNSKNNVVNIMKDTTRVNEIKYIQRGITITKYDKHNCLHTACSNFTNGLKVVLCLLKSCNSTYEKNKLINSKSSFKLDTPLHISCKYNNYRIVRLLLSNNANWWCKDYVGRTALDIAYSFENLECINVFEDYYRDKGIAGRP